MKHSATLALLLVLGVGCGGGADPQPELKTQPKSEARPSAPAAPAVKKPEAEHITIAHVLIAFAGTGTAARRPKADAEKLAADVLARAKKGEDFDKLMRDLSDDTGGGVYRMANAGVRRTDEEEFSRNKMVAAFGDVGFQLDIGEIGMAGFDPRNSPYGWHIIKRLK